MTDVYLYIYDLSNGLAAQISVSLTGRFFKAIYHTSIVFGGREYFFGGSGVESSLPAESPHGTPIEKRLMGKTQSTSQDWHKFLEDCANDYGVGKYHILEKNCNNFSDSALQFLLQQHIDPEIASLPGDFLNTPLGIMLRPQIDAMYAPRPGAVTENGQVRTEVPIDGPTSGNHVDRTKEAFTFINTPTMSKLFGKLKTQLSDERLTLLEEAASKVVAGKSVPTNDFASTVSYLSKYFDTVPAPEAFPGLDLLRILVRHRPFASYLNTQLHLLDKILILVTTASNSTEDTVMQSTKTLLFKFLSNALVDSDLREGVVHALRVNEALELVCSAPMSASVSVREHGIKLILNLLVLADGIDDDFKLACLASLAEVDRSAHEPEMSELLQKVIKEIVEGGSEAIEEMVEILELQV